MYLMLEKLPSVTFTKGKIQVAILYKKLFLIGFLMLLSQTPLTEILGVIELYYLTIYQTKSYGP